ncbi:MAG: HPr(Ser) kinase/phosphatase [Candidatus Aminicenantes bacterium]|nr:MAG: HPr(Ser) kinase/phosphatase [Candidatus Aminicenantes bacterium]
MNEGRGNSLQVRHFYQKAKIPLELRTVSGKTGFLKTIQFSSSQRDSLPVEVWGRNEIQKLGRMSREQRNTFIQSRIRHQPCLILSDGLTYPQDVTKKAKEWRIALFVTVLSKSKSKVQLRKLFSSFKLSQHILSGGLLHVFGRGVLILGDSGVGKSESALELISRGHLFVSDDIVQIKKDQEGKLIGSAASLSRNFMEIRGLGIINIKKIFGEGSICKQTKIDLVIMLKRWKEGKEYDRLGLKFPENQKILGVDVPKISIPVAPGRNIATLIEVACKVFVLKQKGYHAALEITEKLDRALAIR